ncbi:MAG: MaoC/PaaZ C-terminal domain-containing protein [Actinomycetota bacterium]
MPVRTSAIGHQFDHIDVATDARWTMAYAAGVPDERAELYRTDGELSVHPLFPVGPEWVLVTGNRSLPDGLTLDEARRGIHLAHDLLLTRPLTADAHYRLTAFVAGVARRSAGATTDMIVTATDERGEVAWRTRMSSLYLGVELEGESADDGGEWPTLPEEPNVAPVASQSSFVRPVDAHVYTECARIFNPIHTDVVAARAAGLAAPILHGTATLARAVSIATDLVGVPIAAVSRIAGRFGAMVDLNSTIEVRVLKVDQYGFHFDVLNQAGQRAIAHGVVEHA